MASIFYCCITNGTHGIRNDNSIIEKLEGGNFIMGSKPQKSLDSRDGTQIPNPIPRDRSRGIQKKSRSRISNDRVTNQGIIG